MAMSNRKKARDIRKHPTERTLIYLQGLIAYKRTHIEREQERLDQLEKMESELLAIVK